MFRRMILLTTTLSAAAIILLTFACHGDPAEEALIREFPDALIYRGVGLYHNGDYRGATQAWKRYITIAPSGSDTLSVREMIKEAEGRRLR
jgi:hypothetical protein